MRENSSHHGVPVTCGETEAGQAITSTAEVNNKGKQCLPL